MKYLLVFVTVFSICFFSVRTLSKSNQYVIRKFIDLNESTERSNRRFNEANSKIMESMHQSALEGDSSLIKSAEEIRFRTIQVIESLDQYKEMFVEITGGYIDGKPLSKQNIMGEMDFDGVGHYMLPIEEGGQGHGEDMKLLISEYSNFMAQLMKDYDLHDSLKVHFINITPDASEDQLYVKNENKTGMKWEQIAFEYSPPHPAISYVSTLQADVLNLESLGLTHLFQIMANNSQLIWPEYEKD